MPGLSLSCNPTGDADSDNDCDCDDAVILGPFFESGTYDSRADLCNDEGVLGLCDGRVNLADAVAFTTLLETSNLNRQTIEIRCTGATLAAVPNQITLKPGDWIRIRNMDAACEQTCLETYAVIDFPASPGLFPGGLSYEVPHPFLGHCDLKIPVSASAGMYKYDVTVFETLPGPDPVCIAIANNPLDPYIVVDPAASGVDELLIPGRFALHAAAPNPFQQATTVAFDVPPDGGIIRIAICDVAGRLVRLLVESPQAPGRKSITWDGRDDRGSLMPTGIYLVRMQAERYSETRKLVLAR